MSILILALALPYVHCWSYSSATHPDGSVFPIGGGGILYRDGHYFIMTVGHAAANLGEFKEEWAPGSGTLGRVAYTNNAPDIALIDTGTDQIKPIMRISNAYITAKVTSYANSNLPEGKRVCHSGWSDKTQASEGYRCGQLVSDCLVGDTRCEIKQQPGEDSMADANDSGGPVWWYTDDGIELIGFAYARTINDGHAIFSPVWLYASYAWSNVADGYSKGPGGCLMTAKGTCYSYSGLKVNGTKFYSNDVILC